MKSGLFIPLGNATKDVEIPKLSYNYNPTRKMHQVWTEGYRATGECGSAFYHGECISDSFIDACEKLVGDSLDRNEDGTLRLSNGHPSIWACRCFDNEVDARKSFG